MELTASALQTVAIGANVNFPETAVKDCKGYIIHREGSGIVTLRGITNQCRARYKVHFGGNIAVPDGGTAGAVSVAIALSGEPLASTQAIVTPTAAAAFFNVSSEAYIDVPRGCCVTIAIENTSTQAIDVQNANLIVERVA